MRPAAALVAVAIIATACSSSTKKSQPAAVTTTTVPTNVAVYAKAGPYTVGYTTLHMPDRDVAVWYPADPLAPADTKKKAGYDQATPLPKNLKGLVPPKYNTVVTMDAYDDIPGNTNGPFPVVLFSHGFGGYRLVNSALDVGIASWGFVVVAVDYLERGLVTQVTGGAKSDPARDQRLMLASLDLVTAENDRTSSVLHGIVDGTNAAAVGQSAGGGTAFDALNDERVKVAVGWAPVGPRAQPADKPTLIIAGNEDNALTPADLAKEYASFPAPKRRVEIANAGHNTFEDVCVVIRGGGGLVEFAVQNHFISEGLAKLANNGCAKDDLAPEKFWPVAQHFTVAEIRDALGIDAHPVGLGDGISTAFAGITVTYQHAP